MKKYIVRIVTSIIIISMLLNSVVACKNPNNEPPEQENEKTEYITAKQVGSRELLVVDFASPDVTLSHNRIDELRDTTLGQTMLRWTTGNTSDIILEQSANIGDYLYLEFSIYCPVRSNAVIRLSLTNCKSSVELTLDFEGWRSYRIKTDNFSVLNPYPSVPSIKLAYVSGSYEDTIYISNFKATTPTYELDVPQGIDISSPELYKQVTARFRQYYAGLADGSDSAEYNSVLVGKYQNNCASNFELFKTTYNDGKPNSLFRLTVFTGDGESRVYSGDSICKIYERLNAMAIGYAAKGSKYYKNAELLDALKKGLEYGYTYGYGKEIAETGKTPFNDWYYSDVSIPRYLINTLVLIEEDLSEEEIDKYLSPFNKIMPLPCGSASNLLEMTRNVVLASALQGDALRLMSALEICKEVFVYVDELPDDAPVNFNDGGFYSDGSYIQHFYIPYTGTYGINVLAYTAMLTYILAETPFELRDENAKHQFEWLPNAYRPLIYGSCFMATVMGRGVGGTESAYLRSIISVACTFRSFAPEALHRQYDELIKYVAYQLEASGIEYMSAIQLPFIDYMVALRVNDEISGEGEYLTTKIFGSMDRVVHHGPKYGVAIALSSTRIAKYEAINGQNETGWYQGDGMIYIYTDGYDYNADFFGYASPYLMPGTTVNLSERVKTSINPQLLGSNTFAGGVAQGKYGVSGFILGYRPDAYREYTANSFTDKNAVKITAKKSYFMFDNEVVCLGSDIYDESGSDVITVVENRLWREGDTLYINGDTVNPESVDMSASSASPNAPQTSIDARTMYFTNMGGYVFLTEQDVRCQKAERYPYQSEQGTADSRSFLEITLNHGNGDGNLNGRYAYVYLPEATVQETQDYYSRYAKDEGDIVILKRNSSAHAVLERTLGVVGCVFFEKHASVSVNDGNLGVSKIEAESPCTVMVSKNAQGELVISVSDPTQTYSSVKVSVFAEGVTEVVSADDGVSATVDNGVITLTVNTRASCGEAFNACIK